MSLHNQRMKCPTCRSSQINKNGRRGTKQSYRCKECGRQFVESYSSKGYSRDAKQICLNLYRSGMGFRAIERATGVSHNTVINWVRQETSMPLDVAEHLDVSEHTETTDELHELSEAALLDSQAAKNISKRKNVLINHGLSLLCLVASTITSLCSAFKRSKSYQPLIENDSLLVKPI